MQIEVVNLVKGKELDEAKHSHIIIILVGIYFLPDTRHCSEVICELVPVYFR